MQFNETVRFPDRLQYGVQFGPEFVTNIFKSVEHEQRNRVRQRGLCVGECASALKSVEDFRTLVNFFRAMGGSFVGFRFKDWSDFELGEDGVLVELTSTTFQIHKDYQVGSYFERRIIQKPVEDTLVIEDGSPLIEDTDFSVDYATGIVTFDSPPSSPEITAGEFDVPCRFDVERLSASYQDFNNVEWGQIQIREILL